MRAGIFQCAAGGLTPDERLHRLSDALRSRSFDLVVCPELFLSGYDVGERLRERAEPSDGPFASRVSELALECRTAVVYGYPERDGERLFNSAACIDANGHIVANHRKLLLPPGFESRFFEPGTAITVFELHGVRCALLICYDAEFPEAMRAVAEAGACVVIVPTALADRWASVAHRLMPARAFENGIWLLYANHAGVEGATRYLGASCILSPDGEDAARAGAEEVLIASTIDREQVDTARACLPYLANVADLRRKL